MINKQVTLQLHGTRITCGLKLLQRMIMNENVVNLLYTSLFPEVVCRWYACYTILPDVYAVIVNANSVSHSLDIVLE